MAEAYERNKNHTVRDCLSNFPFKQVFTKELDGFTESFWWQSSSRSRASRGTAGRRTYRDDLAVEGSQKGERCEREALGGELGSCVTDGLVRELSCNRTDGTPAPHGAPLPHTERARCHGPAVCTAVPLLQANSAQNIIQCFPAIIGNAVQSSNDYTGVILSRDNTIHYGDTYFTSAAQAELAGRFSCTYLSEKMNTSRFAYWFCVQRTAA